METNLSRSHTVLKWTLAIAMVIITNLFFYYVIAMVYPEPKFESFCPMRNDIVNSAEICVQQGGQWTNNQYTPKQVTEAVKNGEPLGWCDVNFTCNKNYTEHLSIYNRNVFIILIALSLVVLGLGMFLPLEVLALGFSWSGIVSLIIASGRYWSDADNWMRVIILAAALALLIWLAVKKFNDSNHLS